MNTYSNIAALTSVLMQFVLYTGYDETDGVKHILRPIIASNIAQQAQAERAEHEKQAYKRAFLSIKSGVGSRKGIVSLSI